MPLRVRIDRDQCIADMVCVSLCPDVFEMDPNDGKASIKEEFRIDKNNPSEGVVPDNLKECVENAANSCPVGIIHIEPA
jgi:ferredoxin